MNRYIRNSGIVISSILAVTTVNAETWGPKNFSFQGAANAVTYVGWNPLRTPPPSSNQLLEFKFYGSPDPFAGCALEADAIFRDGPVTPVYFTNVTVNTGLPSTNASMTWSPISDPLRCTFSNWQGYAHAHLENYNNGGGIGIYSHTGPRPNDPSQVFFQATQPPTGNQAVSGIFVSFRNQPWASFLTKPFTGNSTDFNNLRVAISSIQRVEKLTL